MANILIIEDEEDLLLTLEYNLKNEGYQVFPFATGEEGLEWVSQNGPPDLAMLDIMLPGMSGIEVCHRLRMDERTRATPILFLSAKGDDSDRVVGFELGADDYVVKPFHVRELMLRVRAILRRSSVVPQLQESSQEVFGVLKMDRTRHRVWLAEQEIFLTAMEFKLLDLLLSNKGRVQSRDTLLTKVWNLNNTSVQTRTVDVHVKRLREKLGPVGDAIETVRNMGYRLRERPTDTETSTS
ncbi:MAG: response regulator transcription factor [Magnetococcales bacterium]|nr:response regulator transcription factor [Magnetococcales bacterium]MBF0114439.1 response regulator transcription factor [Magnetococcales bacterium]